MYLIMCHGYDDVVNMCTDFNPHACYDEQVLGVKKSAEAISCCLKNV